jgi:hypothetical protein
MVEENLNFSNHEINNMFNANSNLRGIILFCFVTTCDNGVFNMRIFMHISIFFLVLFLDKSYFDVFLSTLYLFVIV